MASVPARRDTIAALSTARGVAAIAVIRVSGPAAGAVLDLIVGSRPQPRTVTLRAFRQPASGEMIDRGLALWFPAPASATGEDIAELHAHGGRAVIAALLDAVLSVDGVRAAEPGEFTRRAFTAGKLDLPETEGLADLLAADSEAQRRQALRQSEGALSAVVEDWRSRLIAAMALIEAGIDFSDEEDVPARARADARAALQALSADLGAALADTRAERLRDGFRIAIVGPPNAGKSSLLNALARRDAAIVTEVPGTTRDVVEVALDLGGVAALVADTAGLRATEDPVEREGVRRALARAESADLTLWLEDATDPVDPPATGASQLWRVTNKIDLLTRPPPSTSDRRFAVSVRTGAGLDGLLAAMTAAAHADLGAGEHVGLTRARHRDVLRVVTSGLDAALADWEALPDELIAETLRAAATELGRITGRVGVEDVLDRLFATFCIGK